MGARAPGCRAAALLVLSLGAPAACLVACGSTPAEAPASPSPSDAGSGDAPSRDAGPTAEGELERLLTGRFDSKDQAAKDPTYFEIQLAICKADVPELGPRVLYVEQARMDSLTKPYRQRLYVIERKDAQTAVSRVFELKAPKTWIGACDRGAPPEAKAADAEEKPGCAVEMHLAGGAFTGATGDLVWNGTTFQKSPSGPRCPSELNGATYASSTVTLTETELLSWDRGFDANDKQVWGATAGGYRFLRR